MDLLYRYGDVSTGVPSHTHVLEQHIDSESLRSEERTMSEQTI